MSIVHLISSILQLSFKGGVRFIKSFFLTQQPLSSCWCKTHLTVDIDTCLPAASNLLQTCFLMGFGWLLTPLTSFLSAAGDSLCFLSDGSSDSTVLCTCLQSIVWSVDLVTALTCLQVSFLACLNNKLFQINAELLRLSHRSVCDWV